MEGFQEVLAEVLHAFAHDDTSLARRVGVSASTLRRWLKGEARPRPVYEGRLREILAGLRLSAADDRVREPAIAWPLLPTEADIHQALSATLRELREILHRRGRLSSRNEALEELSKLLFAHMVTIATGGDGISASSVGLDPAVPSNPAILLKEFVQQSFSRHLPSQLSHELSLADLELRLKPQEERLAQELIECFERLAVPGFVKRIAGVEGVDILNMVFGTFLADSFADEKQLGQYLTPTEVVRFMVRLAIQDMAEEELTLLCDPERCAEFGLILDPSCGVGSFLTELLRCLYAEVEKRHGSGRAVAWKERMIRHVLVGIDKSERMVKLALASLIMFGVAPGMLHLANALSRSDRDSEFTSSMEGRVSLILTNPPFGAEFHKGDIASYRVAGMLGKNSSVKLDSEVLFLERYVDWLKPGGRCLAIVPDSVLTNRGPYEVLRRYLADKVELRACVSLPQVAFAAAGTNTKTSVLCFRKPVSGRGRKSSAFFAVCNDVGYDVVTRGTHRTKISNGQGELPLILADFSMPSSQLQLGRRVRGAEASPRWDALYHASLPRALQERLENPSPSDVFVRDVAEQSRARADPRRWGAGTFQYIEISDVTPETFSVHPEEVKCAEAPSRARKLVRAGDVLFSTVRPERRTVGIVGREQDGAVCTTGFAVLTPRGIPSLVLAHLLSSDFVIAQVARNITGIAYPAVEESCLLDALLPIRREELKRLAPLAEEVERAEQQAAAQRRLLAERVSHAVSRWSESEVTLGSRPPQSS